MVATIPEGVYTVTAKKSIISANASKYRAARKKTRSALLDELTDITHLGRKHLSFVLRHVGQKVTATALPSSPTRPAPSSRAAATRNATAQICCPICSPSGSLPATRLPSTSLTSSTSTTSGCSAIPSSRKHLPRSRLSFRLSAHLPWTAYSDQSGKSFWLNAATGPTLRLLAQEMHPGGNLPRQT